MRRHRWTGGRVSICECGARRRVIAWVGVYELRMIETPDGIKHTGYAPECTRKRKETK